MGKMHKKAIIKLTVLRVCTYKCTYKFCKRIKQDEGTKDSAKKKEKLFLKSPLGKCVDTLSLHCVSIC